MTYQMVGIVIAALVVLEFLMMSHFRALHNQLMRKLDLLHDELRRTR